MSKLLRTALAVSVFTSFSVISGAFLPAGATDLRVVTKPHVRVRGPIRNDSHWLLRRARHGLYRNGYLYEPDNANPLTGATRYRLSSDGGAYYSPEAGNLGQTGSMRIAGTRFPTKPSAKIMRVDEDAVRLADQRAERRLERFEAENVEIGFHTPRQAYDVRFPNVIYLDTR